MVESHNSIIYLVPWFVLLCIGITMFIHGWFIMHDSHGWRQDPKIPPKDHPEMKDYNGEKLLVLKFKDKYDILQERAKKMKMDQLFDEPSTYEDELEDGSDY